ncbi:MAG: ribose-phosphate diphosphokinase [Thermoprotei archaeon]|mgnify:FL=1|nr:MAG: ribose-phosphate diphosphokinase [Thermoprotei archaeon]
MRLAVLGGSSAKPLAFKIAKDLGVEFINVETRKFPDGEKYVRILGDVEGKNVVVVQSMYHRPDEYLLEYFLMVDALKDLGAKKVIGVIPYFAYARQDQRFKPGEAISLKTVSKLIEKAGTDELYVIDIHRHRVEEAEFSRLVNIPVYYLTAMPELAKYAVEHFNLDNPVVIGPDAEAKFWAKIAAETIGAEYDYLEKQRISDREVVIKPKKLNVKGREVLIVDDIVSTGGTMVRAIEVIKREGAKRIITACTHPVLVEDALTKILMAGAEALIGTDTIPSPVSVVSVAPIIARNIREKLLK